MDDLLGKPYTLEQFAKVVRRWIVPVARRSPAAAAEADRLSSIDETAIARLRRLAVNGRANLYVTLVDLFRAESTSALGQLQTAFLAMDLKTGAALCHKLASAAANVGALAFAGDVRRLGQLCVAGDTAGSRALHDKLQQVHPALIEQLTRLQMKESA